MTNQIDVGLKEDLDNMTKDLGRTVLVYPREVELTYEGQEAENSGRGTGVEEIAFVQELNSEHEMVAAGQLDVGDVRLVFSSDTIAEEEGFVSPDDGTTIYKILRLTIVKNMNNNVILEVKGFGKKIPNR